MSASYSFTGKTVFVTGGCGGLGLAISNAFYEAGANVVAGDINAELIKAFESSHEAERAIAINCNVADPQSVATGFDLAKSKFSNIDVVVNNAGLVDRFDPAGTVSKELWDRVIAVNLTGPMLVTQQAVRGMLENNLRGSIVNIASISAQRGFSAGCAYTASKHGLIGLTKNTAAFYADKNIRCNAVLPVGMSTNIGSGLADGYNEEGMQIVMSRKTPFVDVKKVADMVLFLASDASSEVNGACLAADNAWMAG